MIKSLMCYKYYDTPEGQDIFKKTFCLGKQAGLLGFIGASMEIMMVSNPKGIINTAGRYAFLVGPTVGMAAAYTVTSNVARNIRGKDGYLNQFLGGMAAGGIGGAWARSAVLGVPLGVFIGISAIAIKTAVDNDYDFYSVSPSAANSIRSARHDWTIAKDPVEYRTYITGPN